MEWLLIVLAAGGGGYAVRQVRSRLWSRRYALEQLDGVRRLADEDVTSLGEQLQRLDREVEGRRLDEGACADYQTALDAYEAAQRAVPRVRSMREISEVTDILSAGRYALACVQARVAGRAVPERRVPCFFNAQHGPSVLDVMWTQPGEGTRRVPACAQDAARVACHDAPEVRKVRVGSRALPHHRQAGEVCLSDSRGYLPEAGALAWAFQAALGFERHVGSQHGAGMHGVVES